MYTMQMMAELEGRCIFWLEKKEGTFASLEFQPYRSRILQLFDVYVSSNTPPISLRLTEAERKRGREARLFPTFLLPFTRKNNKIVDRRLLISRSFRS